MPASTATVLAWLTLWAYVGDRTPIPFERIFKVKSVIESFYSTASSAVPEPEAEPVCPERACPECVCPPPPACPDVKCVVEPPSAPVCPGCVECPVPVIDFRSPLVWSSVGAAAVIVGQRLWKHRRQHGEVVRRGRETEHYYGVIE